uniref:Uncharacterized protein n=1 Tax=Octopus bimaculoides TaxID=37653 RepID=A0A0L8H1H4_OCTBM
MLTEYIFIASNISLKDPFLDNISFFAFKKKIVSSFFLSPSLRIDREILKNGLHL